MYLLEYPLQTLHLYSTLNDMETTVSTSFQREIHVECLLGHIF